MFVLGQTHRGETPVLTAPDDRSAGREQARAVPDIDGSSETGILAEELLTVHVVGEVHAPGIVRIASGSRVHEAIEAAGGATDAASLASVNLARTLTDGEQVFIPGPDDQAAPPAESSAAAGRVQLNRASSAELQSLPGIGAVIAERVIEHRTKIGGFTSIDQLLEVQGIGVRTLERFRDRLML